MPLNTFRKITPKPQIKPSNSEMLKAYESHRVTYIGKNLTCSVNDRQELCDFYTVHSKSPPILGLTAYENLGIITRGVNGVEAVTVESLNTTCKDVCTVLGCFKEPYHTELKDVCTVLGCFKESYHTEPKDVCTVLGCFKEPYHTEPKDVCTVLGCFKEPYHTELKDVCTVLGCFKEPYHTELKDVCTVLGCFKEPYHTEPKDVCTVLGCFKEPYHTELKDVCTVLGCFKEPYHTELKDVCTVLGCFKEPYHTELKEDTVPVKEPPRRVQVGLQDRLKLKLDQMETQMETQKINKPIDWIHNLVKDGSLRLCLDPRELNKAIKQENFQIPTMEGVTSLNGKKVFTAIDLKNAFWQVPLSEESAHNTIFNTPFGRYFFTRMPFGLCSASEVLQKRVYQTFGDIEDVHVIADDIIIVSNSEEEAGHTLNKRTLRSRSHTEQAYAKKQITH